MANSNKKRPLFERVLFRIESRFVANSFEKPITTINPIPTKQTHVSEAHCREAPLTRGIESKRNRTKLNVQTGF